MLNDFSVNNSDPDTSVNGDPDNVHQYSNEFTRYLKSNEKTVGSRNIVTYTNKPRDILVNELQIKKKILGNAYNENDAFEYRIFLESKEGAMVAYDLGEYYQIDAQGRYLYYQNGIRMLQSENPEGPYTYTLDGQTVTSDTPRYAEHTSINGSLGDIRDGDTIIIKGLMEGTEFYVYERTNYDYMSKDDTLIKGKYVFDGTEVTDAAIRATQENWPAHPVGTLYDAPTGLDDLLSSYNASAYEQSKAATGILVQGEGKDAKVLVKNRPCGEISVEKEWLDEDGEALEDHPDGITYTIYQLKHEHEWAVYNSATGTWDDTRAAEGDGWHTVSDNGHTKVEERRCRFDYCDHCTETRTTIQPCEEHHWSEWETTSQPTCTASGLQSRTCSVCGAVETQTIAKLGHDWDIVDDVEHWVVTTQPSCTQAGEETTVCERCGLEIHRPYGAPLGHEYVESITTPATCTEDGVMSLVCSRCGDTQSDVAIPALGHDMGEWHDITASCTEGGTEHRDCQREGCSYSETRATEPLGHDMVWTSNGNGTETGRCSRCGYEETRPQQNLVPGTMIVTNDDAWPDSSHGPNDSISLVAGNVFKYIDANNVPHYYLIYSNATQNYSNLMNGPANVLGWGFLVELKTDPVYNSQNYDPTNSNLTAGTIYEADDGSYYIWKNTGWGGPSANPVNDSGNWYHLVQGNRSLNTLSATRSLKRSALMYVSPESMETVETEGENADEGMSDQDNAETDKFVSEPQLVNTASLANRSVNGDNDGDASGTQLRSADILRSVSVTQVDLTLAQLLDDLSLTALNVKNPDTGNTLTEYKPGQTLETKSDSETLADTNLWHMDHTIPVSENDNIEYRYYVVETDPVADGDYTVTYTGQTNGLVPSGTGSHNVKVTNQKKPEIGNLLISKVITGVSGDMANQSFTFNVTLTAPAGVTLESSYATEMTGSNAGTGTQTVTSGTAFTVTLQGGDTWKINDLPNGTTYSVSEETPLPTGWTLTSASPQTGTISKNSTQSVEFTNVYSEVTKAPKVTKVLAGRTTWRNDESYTFKIVPEGDITTTAVTAGKIVMPSLLTATATASDPTAVFDNITFKDEGTYFFTITEQSGSDTTMAYSQREVRVRIAVTKTEGVLSAVMTYAEAKNDEGTAIDGVLTYADTVQQFTNEQLGSLTIDKTVRVTGGRPDQDAFPSGTYTYPVSVTTVIDGNTYYVQDTNGTLGTSSPATPLTVTAGPLGIAGTALTISNLHYGKYTVTELNPDMVEVQGFSFIVEEGNSVSVTSGEGTVNETQGEVHLVNYYMRGASWTPEVDKWINGIPYTENAAGYSGYTFTLSEPETQNTINTHPGPGHGPGQESSHMDTKTTGTDGKAVFARIVYHHPDLGGAASKEYYYTITENRPEQAQDAPYIEDNIRYDTKVVYVVVTVTRSGGAMNAQAAYYSDAEHTQSLTTAYFDNTELGTLTVTKSVTGSYTATDSDKYPFTVKKGDQFVTGILSSTTYTYSGLSDTDPGYTVKANETLTFTNLPVGTYVVEEGSISKTGYVITTTYQVNDDDSTSESAEAQVVKGQTTAVTINNHYRDAQLVIKKTVAGVESGDMDTVADSITITVKDSANNTILDNVKLSESPFSADNGVYTATLKSTDDPVSSWAQYIVPDGTYTVTETMADVTGYTLRSSTYQIAAKENVDVTEAESGTGYELQLTDVDTSTGEIDYTNTYVKLVDIEVNKEWEIGIDTRWPDDVDSVVVKLQQSVNGGDPVDVGPARTATITKDNWTLTEAGIEAMEEGEAKTAAQNSLAARFIKDLPKYDDNGNLITYSVVEITPASGFNVTYTPAGTTTGGLITVKNQKDVEPLELTVKKEWKKGSTDNAVETTVTDDLFITYEVWRKTYTDAARTALLNEDGAPEKVTGLTQDTNGFTGVLDKDSTTVTSDGGQQFETLTPWEQTVTALPAQGTITSGEEPDVTSTVVYYSYYVKEIKVSGGMFGSEGVALEQAAETPATSGDDAGKLVLVNRLREYEAVKNWENVDEEKLTSETTPASVTYNLYRSIDGVRDPDFGNEATLTISDKSGNVNTTWKKLWKGLPIEGSFTYIPEGGEVTTKTGIYDYAVEETKIVYGGTEYPVSGNVDATGRWIITQIENTVTNKLNETEFEFSKVWKIIDQIIAWDENLSIDVRITRTTGTGNDRIIEDTGFITIGINDEEKTVSFTSGDSSGNESGGGVGVSQEPDNEPNSGNGSNSSAKIVRLSSEGNIYRFKLKGIEKYYQGDTTKEWTYSIEERQVEGYNKPKYYTIKIISGEEEETEHPYSADNISVSAGDVGGVKIVNDKITVELPNAGGPGTNLIYLLGLMLTGLAGAGLVLKRRRRNAA